MVLNTLQASGLEPIPFVDSHQRGDATQQQTQSQSSIRTPGSAYSGPWEHELRQEEQTTVMMDTSAAWNNESKVDLVGLEGAGVLLGDAQVVGHWMTHPTASLSIGVDPVPMIKTESVKPKAPPKKKRAPRKKAAAAVLAPPVVDAGGLVLSRDELTLAKRKSEIEKKSRQKRANNIGSMKDQVTRLEQNLLHLIRQQGQQNQYLLAQDPHIQLTLQGQLIRLREKLARQFSDSVELRNEQVQLYQQLQHYVDIKESLTNFVSAHDFSDPAVYDLLARWTPPSDAECIELANESMGKILSFKFTKRCATDHHAGWKLTYEQFPLKGFQFGIDRKMSSIDVPALTQTIWDARATSEGGNVLAGMVCKAHMSIIKAVSKDMLVVNRTLCFPQFTLRAVYLLFRREVNGQIYVVSRELGSAQDLTMTQAMASVTQEQWIDVFSWSTFQKLPDESTPGDTYNVMYGGWWNSSFALSIRRWLLEMLFMVVRWENVYVQPRLLNQ